MNRYEPPYTLTSKIVKLTSDISELITEIKFTDKHRINPKLRKKNRIKSITGTLQIEGNSFDETKVTSIINGKTVFGTQKEIEEVKGAVLAYEHIDDYDYKSENDLLYAHKLMMGNLLNNAGKYRQSDVGIGGSAGITHIAPPAGRVPWLMKGLFEWLNITDEHLFIAGCVFHYEFEFIHPFSDGNGRIGRLWHSLILKAYKDVFAYIPIENLIKENQAKYYKALKESGIAGESTPFIEFMLEIILQSLKEYIKENVKSNQKSSQKSDQKILQLIKQDPRITIAQISYDIGMSESGVKKVIKKLKDNGKLKRTGSLKAGRWEIED